MKIKQIHIFNYGKWHNVTIPLNSGLNILYGCNEAGKTTLLSFIKGVLFGYLQRRTSHKNYIPRKSKNYGGQLDISMNSNNYIVQRMAGKNGGILTILNSRGDRLGNSVLKKILGPFNRDTFNALYCFGDVNLKRISKLKQRDLIYRIQRVGLAHSDDWINYRNRLDKQAKKIYSPRGYKPPLNQKLKQYSQLVVRIKRAKANYQTYRKLLNRIRQLKKNYKTIQNQLNNQNQRASQIKQDQDAWVRYRKINSLRPAMDQIPLSGFTDNDVYHLQNLRDRLTQINNRAKLNRQQLNSVTIKQNNNDEITYYRRHYSVINHLANYFNSVEAKLQRIQLLQHRDVDLENQLKGLIPKYTFNSQLLKPMNQGDQQKLKYLNHQLQKSRQNLQTFNQKLVIAQKPIESNLYLKNSLGYGASVLLLIVGFMIALPISMIGIGLGLIWFAYQFHLIQRSRNQMFRIRHQIHDSQQIIHRFKRIIDKYRVRYHYPAKSVTQWLIVQNDLKRIKQLRINERDVQHQINQLANQLTKYFRRWTFMNHQLTLSSNQSSQLLQLKNYVSKMNRTLKINHQVKSQRRIYLSKLNRIKEQQRKVHNVLTMFYRVRKIKNVNQFNKRRDQQHKLIQRQRTYRDLSKQLGTNELANLKRYHTYDDVKSLATKVSQIIMKFKNQLQIITRQLTTAKVELYHLIYNGSYDELQQRLANARTEINEMVKRWLEMSLASQWIDTSLNLATKGRVPKIERQAQLNFQILTNGRYLSIIFNKTQIKVMRNDKRRFTLYELSKGTVQQLYLALIFAMGQVFSQDYPMPILIDDGFTDFDVERRQAALKLLRSISHKLQVVYCTSDENLVQNSRVINLSQI